MKTDRELLELAAKAAGLEFYWHDFVGPMVKVSTGDSRGEDIQPGYPWDPINRDGDAMRLVVKLRLNVHVWEDGRDVSVAKTLPDGDNPPDEDASAWFSERDQCGDIYIATRRAVVRAAAAIGESMK